MLVVENGQWSVSGKEAAIAGDEAPDTGHYVLDMRTQQPESWLYLRFSSRRVCR